MFLNSEASLKIELKERVISSVLLFNLVQTIKINSVDKIYYFYIYLSDKWIVDKI